MSDTTIRTYTAEPVFPLQAQLGEGPVWQDDAFWCVDIEGKTLNRFDPATKAHAAFDADQRIGVAVPTDNDGEWLVGLECGLAFWRPEDGAPPAVFATPEADRPGNRFNDGKVDPRGRFFAGTMSMQCDAGCGALYRVGADRLPAKVLDGVTISNGLSWDAAANTFYYIDTPTRRVDAFDWDPATGAIANRRKVIEFAEGLGSPDGHCIDAEGKLWVAMWGGGAVLRVDPASGRVVGRVEVDAPNVTSCCFGGPGLSTLYITTPRIGMDAAASARHPHAGDVFAAEVEYFGLPTEKFRTA